MRMEVHCRSRNYGDQCSYEYRTYARKNESVRDTSFAPDHQCTLGCADFTPSYEERIRVAGSSPAVVRVAKVSVWVARIRGP